MAHEIETFANGSAAFFGREDAWHRLGTVIPDGDLTMDQILDHAMLANWNVRKQPLLTRGAKGHFIPVPNMFSTVRTNPSTGDSEVLGVVGNSYQVIQNEAGAQFLANLVGESGGKIVSAGSLRGGTQTFVVMKTPDTINVGGFDAHDSYVTLLNSHDGSQAFQALHGHIRVVCANTQDMAIKGATNAYKVKHTTNANANVMMAREALEMSFKRDEMFQAEADRLLDSTFSEEQFNAFLLDLFGKPTESKRGITIAENRTQDLNNLFTGSETMTQIRGTKWAAYNAVTEYFDWFNGSEDITAAQRAERSLTTNVQSKKEKAFALLSV